MSLSEEYRAESDSGEPLNGEPAVGESIASALWAIAAELAQMNEREERQEWDRRQGAALLEPPTGRP